MRSRSRLERGISLIEALVALALMAFGMLGMAGMQASLRLNADVARQRSEAVRIAQEVIENARSYSIVQAPAAVGKVAFDGVVSVPAQVVAGYTTNTTYTRTIAVVDRLPQNVKSITVDVAWADRTNTTQSVRLTANLHRLAPELAAALSVPGSGTAVQLPGGRHATIPRVAVDQGNGTSRFDPPGAAGVSWVFSNTTGFVTRICLLLVCTDVDGRFLGGYVAFSTGPTQPTPAQAEDPQSPAIPVDVMVTLSYPAAPIFPPACFVEPVIPPATPVAYAYYCVVPVSDVVPRVWSGSSGLAGLPLAADVLDFDTTKYRVCRYTPYRSHPVVGSGSPPVTNADHPLVYENVAESLANQNFLVIKAGDGTTPFTCPADDPGTSAIPGNTWHHQPSS